MSVIESLRNLKKQTLLKLSEIYSVAALKKTGTLDVAEYMDRVKGIGDYKKNDNTETKDSDTEPTQQEEEPVPTSQTASKSSKAKKSIKL